MNILQEYNKAQTEHKVRTVDPDKAYKSVLEQQVKRGVPTTDPNFDDKLCWYCQENERIKTPQMSKIWCMRCYILMNTKHDGTLIEQNVKGIGSDLAEINKKLQDGKIEYDQVPKTRVIDDLPPIA
jgi:hypothetical protein